MNLVKDAGKIHAEICKPGTKLGDLRKIAKEVKKDHKMAMELWSSGDFMPRQLAILIMDKKLLSEELVDELCKEIQDQDFDSRNHLADWLMANQLSKDKKTVALMESWEESPIPIQRRLFWYYQARLRWMGQSPPGNTGDLLASIESKMLSEEPEVQWAMNFTAGWIGVFEKSERKRCIAIGEQTGLYKDEVVARNCTPAYLPEFIRIEAGKRKI